MINIKIGFQNVFQFVLNLFFDFHRGMLRVHEEKDHRRWLRVHVVVRDRRPTVISRGDDTESCV